MPAEDVVALVNVGAEGGKTCGGRRARAARGAAIAEFDLVALAAAGAWDPQHRFSAGRGRGPRHAHPVSGRWRSARDPDGPPPGVAYGVPGGAPSSGRRRGSP